MDPWLFEASSARGQAAFHAVVGSNDVRCEDESDVEAIHSEARSSFARLVERVRGGQATGSGRSLLLLGEAGAGKTHLLRSFWNEVARHRAGYAVYFPMIAGDGDYISYMLAKVIDDLARPLDAQQDARSGLQRLSDHLVSRADLFDPQTIEQLKTSTDRQIIRKAANRVCNALVRSSKQVAAIDSDVLPALIHLQCEDPVVTRLVPEFLRCRRLSQSAMEELPGLAPMLEPDDPLRVLEHLARLIGGIDDGALVILIDQLETNAADLVEAEQRFRRAMQAVCHVVDRIPNCVLVVACLRDFWLQFGNRISRSIVDRLTQDPKPVELLARRTGDEAVEILRERLLAIYRDAGLAPRAGAPLHPFREDDVRLVGAGRTAREIVELARSALDRAAQLGVEPPIMLDGSMPAVAAPSESTDEAWSRHLASWQEPTPDFDDAFIARMASLVRELDPLLHANGSTEVREEAESLIVRPPGVKAAAHYALCNRAAQGGALARQLEKVVGAHAPGNTVILRTGEFPARTGKSKVAQLLADLTARGVRFCPVSTTEWSELFAFVSFWSAIPAAQRDRNWLLHRSILATHALWKLVFLPATDDAPAAAEPARSTSVQHALEVLRLGRTTGLQAAPFDLSLRDLTRHVAIVGGSGSGKTTLALHLLERALAAGVPVVAVDRKGDLAAAARPEAFAPKGEPRDDERSALRERLAVRLLTPGDDRGKNVALPVIASPDELRSESERRLAIDTATDALSSMLGARMTQGSKQRQAVIRKGLEILLEYEPEGPLSLDRLIRFLGTEDPALVGALGLIDPKCIRMTASELQTLLLNQHRLLANDAAPLDAAELFGANAAADRRTPLTIFSLVGLPSEEAQIFWVSRLLTMISAYAQRVPSERLQALVFLDEADRYLPAVGNPPTKQVIESAVRRWRSAGIGLVIASQSPADFDYRCRDNIGTWFVGRVKEARAHEKMKSLFDAAGPQFLKRLPQLETGRFIVATGDRATEIAAERSLSTTTQLSEDEILRLAHGSA